MSSSAAERPELVFALAGAIGADLDAVSSALRKALSTVNYHAIDLNLLDLAGEAVPAWQPDETSDAYARATKRMDCGNKCRADLGRKDALALFGIAGIQARRKSKTGDATRTISNTAFILRSLKTPEEVASLRKAYGQSCYIIAAYCPYKRRRENLARKIAKSRFDDPASCARDAEDLIERDTRERGNPFGQNLRDTFYLADFFLDGSSTQELEAASQRFIDIVFGHPWRTPSREEFGMFQAYGAALRSASAGRQVGAAIARDGEILAIGTNEVPKAFGGQYWEGDEPDGRDHCREHDSTHEMTRAIFADLLARLRAKDWLGPELANQPIKTLIASAESSKIFGRMEAKKADDPPSLGERASLMGLVEFMRAVHAEMAALVSAARTGISANGSTLFSTAFPCHECARHIVAAGIRKVYFIEPYPKSRVAELYDDSITIDGEDSDRVPFCAFTGVAPRLYTTVFEMPNRKSDDGKAVVWDLIRNIASPRRYESNSSGKSEDGLIQILNATTTEKKIQLQN